MAHDYDVMVRIKFLMSARRYVAHRNVFGPIEMRRFILPRLTDIEQSERFAALLQRLHLAGRDFEVHRYLFLGSSGKFRSVVKLVSAATTQRAPVPMRAPRTSADGMLYHRVNPQPIAKFTTSTPKKIRSRRHRVSKARPMSKRIQTM